MRGWAFGVALALLLAGAAVAQEPTLSGSPVMTLDQDRLFAESKFGREVLARNEAEETALAAENRRLEAALEAEERSLTDLRTRMDPAEFRKLADEFDIRVEEVRRAQDARFRALVRQREEDRRKFIEAALPVLGRLMGEMGAVVLLERSAIVLSFGRIDITDDAIARLDVELGEGPPETDTLPDAGADTGPVIGPGIEQGPETAPDVPDLALPPDPALPSTGPAP